MIAKPDFVEIQAGFGSGTDLDQKPSRGLPLRWRNYWKRLIFYPKYSVIRKRRGHRLDRLTTNDLKQLEIAKRTVKKDRKARGHDQRRAKNSVNHDTKIVPMTAGQITFCTATILAYSMNKLAIS